MKEDRRKRFVAYFESRFNGDRSRLMQITGLTAGRISQLFDPRQPFAETASRRLAESFGLRPDYFERDTESGVVWPFEARVPYATYEALGEREKGFVDAKLAAAVEEARTGLPPMPVEVTPEAHQFDARLISFDPSLRTSALLRAMCAIEDFRLEINEKGSKPPAQAPAPAAVEPSPMPRRAHKTQS